MQLQNMFIIGLQFHFGQTIIQINSQSFYQPALQTQLNLIRIANVAMGFFTFSYF